MGFAFWFGVRGFRGFRGFGVSLFFGGSGLSSGTWGREGFGLGFTGLGVWLVGEV